jgi:type II secretory pathway component GspD/PulD (secretin)
VLESGHTAVLGGLVVERATYEDNGIPVLKDIPLINYLFKQRWTKSTRNTC